MFKKKKTKPPWWDSHLESKLIGIRFELMECVTAHGTSILFRVVLNREFYPYGAALNTLAKKDNP